MATVLFKGNPIQTNGDFPEKGQQAKDFKLVAGNLSEVSLKDLKGKKVVMNIFPSVDTDVCALQLKSFSQKLSSRGDLILLSVSMDLPFALNRFCAAQGIENAMSTSDFRHHSMENYGVKMTDGPLASLYARAVLVMDENHKIIYSELVNEVTNEPDYQAAIDALTD